MMSRDRITLLKRSATTSLIPWSFVMTPVLTPWSPRTRIADCMAVVFPLPKKTTQEMNFHQHYFNSSKYNRAHILPEPY